MYTISKFNAHQQKGADNFKNNNFLIFYRDNIKHLNKDIK